MTDLQVSTGHTWRVLAHVFPDADQAEQEWLRHRDVPGGNFSAWRVLTPSTGEWLVIVCGRPEHLPTDLRGEPVEVPLEDAFAFAMRRARMGVEAAMEGKTGHVSQVERYGPSGGRRLTPDGQLQPRGEHE
jgi:hypothetical protein